MTKTQYQLALWKHRAFVIALLLGGLTTVVLLVLTLPILAFSPNATAKLVSIRDALKEKSEELKANKELLSVQKKRLYP